ncbi:hypothetical protein QAD02_021881 [Eretmocerus hayati]|uniref:Uncharacterized protein n=1 Tax=Eretmocerus hayati TaxID=131215 RepID=A0ACC2PRR4_9HYME|nr:hypothetical protein QAD02_021881 [Eretmocerus hayati]
MNLSKLQSGSFGVGAAGHAFHRGKMTFCLMLHHLIPVRSYVGNVIEQCDDFTSELLVPRILEELRTALDSRTYSIVENIIEGHKKPFELFSTEKKRFNIFRTDCVYVDPELFRIGQKSVRTLISESCKGITIEPVYATRIPLIRALETFFQLPGVYNAAKVYMNSLVGARTMTNYRQGSMWKTKYSNFSKHEDAFNLEVWYDDLQTGNALRSAAGEQKLGGVFVRCPCLPPHLINKLYSLFATVIFYSKEREEYGNRCAFCKLIEEIQILHDNGLRISIDGEEKTLFFALTQLIRDNLALNCACGFSKGFTAKNYCRCCTATADECRSLTQEVPTLVRTKESYDEIIRNNQIDENHPVDGIIEECVFNEVPEFQQTLGKI